MSDGAAGTLREFDVVAYLSEERALVEEALQDAVTTLEGELPDELRPVVRHGVLTGGKRIRPILCVSAYRACGGEEGSAIYGLGASLELIHAYSLMHDDLPCMDDAALRRGTPTPHRIYGEQATTVAAATLIPAAALLALRSARALGRSDEDSRGIVRELLRAAGAGGMVGGQALDLMAEGQRLGAEAMDALHGLKTGALLAASLRIGGMAAGAPSPVQDALDRYGREVGLAFQIVDDILDATASPGALGKNPSDQALAKSTYVGLHGLEEAQARARALVHSAHQALRDGGLDSLPLAALADYIVDRKR